MADRDQAIIGAVLERGAVLYSHFGPQSDGYAHEVTLFAEDAIKLVGYVDRLRAELEALRSGLACSRCHRPSMVMPTHYHSCPIWLELPDDKRPPKWGTPDADENDDDGQTTGMAEKGTMGASMDSEGPR